MVRWGQHWRHFRWTRAERRTTEDDACSAAHCVNSADQPWPNLDISWHANSGFALSISRLVSKFKLDQWFSY